MRECSKEVTRYKDEMAQLTSSGGQPSGGEVPASQNASTHDICNSDAFLVASFLDFA